MFVAVLPEGLGGWFAKSVEEMTLAIEGFGGGETAAWGAVGGVLSLGAPRASSLGLTCCKDTSVTCTLVTDAAITASAGLFLP